MEDRHPGAAASWTTGRAVVFVAPAHHRDPEIAEMYAVLDDKIEALRSLVEALEEAAASR